MMFAVSGTRRPTLFTDADGNMNCGVCGYLAIAVSGRDADGRYIEVRTPVAGQPLSYICVNCLKPWEQCGPPCEPL